MNPEIFAEWLRRQRLAVRRTESSWWFEARPRVYQAFPYHWVIRPRPEELAEVLAHGSGLALRYSTPLEEADGYVSYHILCEDAGYGLESIGRQSRQNVRRGLASCAVQPIPLERLAAEGWALELDTCRRQGRDSPYTERTWRERLLAARGLEGFEAWGALVGGRLAASLLAVRIDDCYELLSQQCLEEFAPARVNHALVFEVTRQALQRAGVQRVFYTLQSLDAPASVDAFKLRMGFAAKPLRQRVVLHPWVAPLVGAAHAVMRSLSHLNPSSPTLSKGEGLLRFYLQGKLPAEAQVWPEFIERQAGARPSLGSS